MLKKILVICGVCIGFVLGCGQGGDTTTETVEPVIKVTNTVATVGLKLLSEYHFFKGKISDLIPEDGVIPYDLNTPLFSDYAHKARFVRLPEGTSAQYEPTEAFDFPVGTVLIKNFYYPNDFRDESKGRRILETRLLMHQEDGWVALPYIWNDEQTDATLEITGGHLDIEWTHYDGSDRKLHYAVPNVNQCKGCHVHGNTITPIGPKARNLNGDYDYPDGGKENQLQKWASMGILKGLPEMSEVPANAHWDDNAASLNDRARAYLDINCGHCHNPAGPANTSGLLLDANNADMAKLGFYKSPIAAGRGAGNLDYDIVPGAPDNSILLYRMTSLDPGVMMPELGRKTAHKEGLQLIRDWIASLKPADYQ